MGGCSHNSNAETPIKGSCTTPERGIYELIKVNSIEKANSLLKQDHVFLTVYWNPAEQTEVYILGRLEKEKALERRVGFYIE